MDTIKIPETDVVTKLSSSAEKNNASENELFEVIGVSFQPSGKIYHFEAGKFTAKQGDNVIVETARGIEFGTVVIANTMIPKSKLVLPLKPVIRIATNDDRIHYEENKRKEISALKICEERVAAHGLDMKLIDAEYTFDNSKLLFYFTSDDRVDFRELVKDLAAQFRVRIELRQIGIRDETKLMGGLGVCYRDFCCHSFLGDFAQVSIKMAKEQGLSLNSSKISGACGRLMCCLKFEHETYEEELKKCPKLGARVSSPDGPGEVVELKPLMAQVRVKLDSDPEGAPKLYPRDTVYELNGNEESLREQQSEVQDDAEPELIEPEETVLTEPVAFSPEETEFQQNYEDNDGTQASKEKFGSRKSRNRYDRRRRQNKNQVVKDSAVSESDSSEKQEPSPERKKKKKHIWEKGENQKAKANEAAKKASAPEPVIKEEPKTPEPQKKNNYYRNKKRRNFKNKKSDKQNN